MSSKITFFCAAVLTAVSLLLGTRAASDFLEMQKQETKLEELSAFLRQPSGSAENAANLDEPASLEDRFAGYQELHRQNEDLAGWVQIEGTRLDYPVMDTPDRPDYYLSRNFEKEDSVYGLPYLEEGCDLQTPGDNLILYGHNMRDGSMFKTLLSYQEQAFWESHPVIYLDNLTRRMEYQVVFAFPTDSGDDFAYEACINFETEAEFQNFVSQCASRSLYPSQAELLPGDQFLTLSTCAYSKDGDRFVVVGKRVR